MLGAAQCGAGRLTHYSIVKSGWSGWSYKATGSYEMTGDGVTVIGIQLNKKYLK